MFLLVVTGPFYKHLFELMTTKSRGILLCDGDFNIRINPKMDSSNGKPEAKNISKRIHSLMHEMGIVDVWREVGQDYTHYSSAHKSVLGLTTFLHLKKTFAD